MSDIILRNESTSSATTDTGYAALRIKSTRLKITDDAGAESDLAVTGDLATAALTVSAANKLLGSTAGAGAVEEIACTAAGRAILDDADATAQRVTLGVVIGTDVQAYDATLQSLSALGTAADKLAYTTGVDTWAEASVTAAGLAILDDADAAAQRTTLGLGTIATQNANAVAITGGTAALTGASSVTDNSASAALTITQAGAGHALLVEDEASDTTPTAIAADGSVLIGVTAARAFAERTPKIQLVGTAGSVSSFGLLNTNAADSSQCALMLGKAIGDTGAITTSDATLGEIRWVGNDGTGLVNAASVSARTAAAPSSGSMPSKLIVGTVPSGSTNVTSRFEWMSDGTYRPYADNSYAIGDSTHRVTNTYSIQFRPGDGTVLWTTGSGSPEGAVTAVVGSLYTHTDGGASTTLYVKESGSGNTGWRAV